MKREHSEQPHASSSQMPPLESLPQTLYFFKIHLIFNYFTQPLPALPSISKIFNFIPSTEEERTSPISQQEIFRKSLHKKSEYAYQIDNFEKKSAESKYEVFTAQAYEIKQLRRKARLALVQNNTSYLYNEMKQSQEKIAQQKTELADQQNIVENMLFAILKNRLIPGTLPYDRICNLVKGALIPEQIMESVTQKEKLNYENLLKDSNVFQAFIGQKPDEKSSLITVDTYLIRQAELLKSMNYLQFVNCMKMAKHK